MPYVDELRVLHDLVVQTQQEIERLRRMQQEVGEMLGASRSAILAAQEALRIADQLR